jgi:hypothetical protein
MTYRIETVDKHKERYITRIEGPQAAAILNAMDGQHMQCWRDKSVDGSPVAELWVDVTYGEELAGTYNNS